MQQPQQQHTHKVPLSADSILNEYLAQQRKQTHLKRSSTQTAHKVPPSFTKNSSSSSKPSNSNTTCGQRNLLFSISGNHHNQQDDTLNSDGSSSTFVQVQRKLLAFFYIYATIIVALYLTYAVYCYYQQSQFKKQQQQFYDSATTTATVSSVAGSAGLVRSAPSAMSTGPEHESDAAKLLLEFQSKFESKIHLLERYIEVLALDLEDTKLRLKEREKCACSVGCSFNGTKFSDGQKWQHQGNKCDICSCQSGKISCAPRECPKLTCDDAVQLPGQCCPTCMKKCKVNKTLVRHGHTFRPRDLANSAESRKQCKCHDGLIKCEPLVVSPQQSGVVANTNHLQQLQPKGAKNKTIEYLKSILSPHQIQLAQDSNDKRPPQASSKASSGL